MAPIEVKSPSQSKEEGSSDGFESSLPKMTPIHTEKDFEEGSQDQQEKVKSLSPANPRWCVARMKEIYD